MLYRMYELLYSAFGPQHWWPASSPFEVLVGAILTQQAAWSNVEMAIRKLKKHGELGPDLILSLPLPVLKEAIRSSGYFNQKAERLVHVVREIEKGGGLERFLQRPTTKVREELLAIKGIGKETADSIMLYAGGHPVFVVDAYTFRIAGRLDPNEYGKIAEKKDYDAAQSLFTEAVENLAKTGEKGGDMVEISREFHALIVELGKRNCRKSEPLCKTCPLKDICIYSSSA